MHPTISPESHQHAALRLKAFKALYATRGRSFKAANITKMRVGEQAHFTYNETEILALEPDAGTEQLGRGLIRAIHQWYAQVRDAALAMIKDNCQVPDNHDCFVLDWTLKGDLALTDSVSVYISLKGRDNAAPDQYAAEFRLFPGECKGHLFLSYGPQYAGQHKNLLAGDEAFVYDTTPAGMIQQLTERYTQAMQRHAAAQGGTAVAA